MSPEAKAGVWFYVSGFFSATAIWSAILFAVTK